MTVSGNFQTNVGPTVEDLYSLNAVINLTDDNRESVAKKINELLGNVKCHTVIFGCEPDKENFYVHYVGSHTVNFKKADASQEQVQTKIKELLNTAAGNKITRNFQSKQLTVIDAIYRRIWTTSREIHDAAYQSKIGLNEPLRAIQSSGLFSHTSVVENSFSSIIDNLTGERMNW